MFQGKNNKAVVTMEHFREIFTLENLSRYLKASLKMDTEKDANIFFLGIQLCFSYLKNPLIIIILQGIAYAVNYFAKFIILRKILKRSPKGNGSYCQGKKNRTDRRQRKRSYCLGKKNNPMTKKKKAEDLLNYHQSQGLVDEDGDEPEQDLKNPLIIIILQGIDYAANYFAKFIILRKILKRYSNGNGSYCPGKKNNPMTKKKKVEDLLNDHQSQGLVVLYL
ncbi:hypothetical protein E3N88_32708 [Mikania micrantha]|uniref:Uncharacterized protein n=1 Tax=Mikania micrantha TaxID=192012 RepID=A0A5N6MBU1_9ASTR|nr:hypothetical protein E3N88_32708 [Mikania micrantha]